MCATIAKTASAKDLTVRRGSHASVTPLTPVYQYFRSPTSQ